jgi:serralysin
MKMSRIRSRCLATTLVIFAFLAGANPAVHAAFHLWNVKEVFSNADGSVQFVEMFDNSPGETAVSGFKLRSNSDGVIKEFTFPGSLVNSTPGHMLIATSGFGSLAGGVAPTFTFDQSSTALTLPFFNPNATNITFTFTGSSDTMTLTGASLPKDGIRSLTDANASGFPNLTSNNSSGVNSPTNLLGASGGINLSSGDYNGNHTVDAADYDVWRKTPANFGTNAAGYAAWRSHFGNPAGSGSGALAEGTVPEPTLTALQLVLYAPFAWRARRARRPATL